MSENNGKSAAIMRWKVGHRLFFFITQGLVLTHHYIRTFIDAKKFPEAIKAMEESISLFKASMEAFNFSSGYSKEAYEFEVRPSVSPPRFDSLLSGTQYIDHTEMLQQIKSCREYLVDLPEVMKPTYEKYIEAITNLYCNHSKICSRIVGDHKAEPAKIREEYMTRTLKWAGAPQKSNA
jgi:hypothetical protein